MSPRVIRHESTSSRTGLYVLAGALAGLAAGMLLAERSGGMAAMRTRFRGLLGQAGTMADAWFGEGEDGAEEQDEHADETADDDPRYELEARVLDAFENDPVLAARAIDIAALDDDVIELHGWVRTAREMPHAATIARGVPGVRRVVNKLAVRTDRRPLRAR